MAEAYGPQAGYERTRAFVIAALEAGREPAGDWRVALRGVVDELDDIVTRAERMKAAGMRHRALDDVDNARCAMSSLSQVWLSLEEHEALYLGPPASARHLP